MGMVDVKSVGTERLLIHFDSFTTKKSYKINHKLDCNDKCLIYLFICRTCVSNIGVTLDIGGVIIKWKQQKLRG